MNVWEIFLSQAPHMPIFLHIVVLGYGKFQQTTQQCLASLIKEIHRTDLKVTVIDNGSPDDSSQLQTQYTYQYPKIQSVILPSNLGFAGGMNHGASIEDSEWVLLLGSDTILSPNALEILYQHLHHIDLKIGIVGPVTNEAGNAQKLDVDAYLPEDIFKEFQERFPEATELQTPLYRADFFCVAIRKSLWDQLNGLDMSYGRGYYEDFDFCMRAKALGSQAVMLEDMFVYHAGSLSFKSDPEQKQLINNNKKIFVKKFPNSELRHRRVDQLKTIEYYLSFPKSILSHPGIQLRLQSRMQMIQKDQPRSFWKKWLWRKRIKNILSASQP
jgi:GT2 family glycosyltransferase